MPVATRGGTVLPSRGVDRRSRFVTGAPAFHQISMGTALVLAGALVIALVLLVPQPDIGLTNPQFFPAACDTTNGTRTVIATFTLTNHGGISGAVEVDFSAGGTTLSSNTQFEVPAQSSVRGTLSGVVRDCEPHRYSLHVFYPANSG